MARALLVGVRCCSKSIVPLNLQSLFQLLAFDTCLNLRLPAVQENHSHLRQMLAIVLQKGLKVFLISHQFEALRQA